MLAAVHASRPRRECAAVRIVAVACALALLASAPSACTSNGAVFEARFAPELRREGATLSVFGVFKDGRMSPEAWLEMAPRLSPALGARACEAGFGDAFHDADPDAFGRVEDEARSEGITAEILEPFAPHAKGDVIIVFQTYGRVVTDAPRSAASVQMAGPSRGGRGARGMPAGDPRLPRMPQGGLEMSAVLYSVSTHAVVGEVRMKYTGRSADEAIARFSEKLRATLPGATCAGWSF